MSFDENDLRKALDARSGSATPEFRERLKQSLVHGRPTASLIPAIAAVTVFTLTVASVGALIASRQLGRHVGNAASGPRVTSPSPIPTQAPSATLASVQLSAPSTKVVWALVGDDHLYRSTDQGSHWEQRPWPAHFEARPGISFIDDHEGWLVAPGLSSPQCQENGAGVAVLHTTDAGKTWEQLAVSGMAPSQCKDNVWFVDAKHGFVSAWDLNHQPTVYRTSDGGSTWTASTLPDPPDFKTLPSGFSLRVEWIKSFGSKFYLEAYGSQGPGTPYPDIHDRQYIFTSSNGGGTWAWKQKVGSRDMAIVTEARWLEFSPPDRMDESVTGGQQFHPIESNLIVDAAVTDAQLVFADANVGYATGGATLQRTVDGGSHWVAISLPTGAVVKPTPTQTQIPMPTDVQLSAPSTNVVWALVADQYLFRSTDQGNTWEMRVPAPTPVKSGSPLISFADATHGWELIPISVTGDCVQEATELWRTIDGAATWKLVSQTHPDPSPYGYVPVDQCKDAMYFEDSMRGSLVIGDPTTDTPAMFRTDDGGVTWNFESLLPRGGLFSFRVVSITAVGGTALLLAHAVNRPVVYIFVNGRVVTAPDQAVSNVAFLTPTHWLIVQPGLETTDGGQTWHPFATDYSDAAGVASVFVFASDKVGYATVRGDLHRTTDGGTHWEMIKTSWP